MGKKDKKKGNSNLFWGAIIVIGILLARFSTTDFTNGFVEGFKNSFNLEEAFSQSNITKVTTNGSLEYEELTPSNVEANIHFIDVGQGDAILITKGNHELLIDAGPGESEDFLVSELKRLGIKDIDDMIITHYHEDHIGGADAVMDNFEVGMVYLPNCTYNTKAYENMVKLITANDFLVGKLNKGQELKIAPNYTIESLSPDATETFDNQNNYSPVLKITIGDMVFVTSGDAEKEIEEAVLQSGADLDADLYKAAHHGSDTSNTQEFIDAISPSQIVISVGEDNSYGHPMKSVLKRFEKSGANVLRTDEEGTISFYTDGNTIIRK